MRLYSGLGDQFLKEVRYNTLSDKLRKAFESYYGRSVALSELHSWNNSLQYVANLVDENHLMSNMVVLELELPYSSHRIDCMFFGKDKNNEDNVVVIELKQWSEVRDCDVENNIITHFGGSEVMTSHPSFQVEGYHFFLKDFYEIFQEGNIDLSSIVYCHNYSKSNNTVLFSPKFDSILRRFPVFTRDDFQKIGQYLKERLENGKGLEIFYSFRT